MTPKQIIRYIEDQGFIIKRHGARHLIYTDGTTTIPVSRGSTRSVRNVRNIIAEIDRAVRQRPVTAKPEREKEDEKMDIERFNARRLDAHTAPGAAIKPLANGHAKEPLVTIEEPAQEKRKRYDPITKRKLEARIMALYAEGHHEPSDVHRALVSEGFPDSHGTGIIGMERVRYFLHMLLETGVIKQVVVAPKTVAQPSAVAARGPSRMPDTCMGILTDPSLTAEQKVRMLLAYVEL